MPTSETTEALQKAARLRRDIERFAPPPPKRGSLLGRVFTFIVRSLTWLVVLLLAVDGFLAYRTFHQNERAGTTASSVGGPTYSDLQVYKAFDNFAGRVAITNPFAHDIEVFVDVDLYEGEQAVGEISGSVTLRPDSTSVVDLVGSDDFVRFTESRVHLSGWPDPAS